MKKVFKADKNELSSVLEFIEAEAGKFDCPAKELMRISVCVEEIFVNVSQYAYKNNKGEVSLDITDNDEDIIIAFEDNGQPFNPLDNKPPDINAKAEERPIGGLGIHIVKKMMDDVNYEYVNGKNILTIKKKVKNN